MNRRQQIIAITLVVAALSVDRAVAAAPVLRTQPSESLVREWAQRLSSSLGQSLRPATVRPINITARKAPVAVAPEPVELPAPCRACGGPFQFRLPPPVC